MRLRLELFPLVQRDAATDNDVLAPGVLRLEGTAKDSQQCYEEQ
jgi:hypothetical protein